MNRYQCKICNRIFKTESGAVNHVTKQHAGGAYATSKNGLCTMWNDEQHESQNDGKWQVVCEIHSTCCNFSSKAMALTAVVDGPEFCELCAGTDWYENLTQTTGGIG